MVMQGDFHKRTAGWLGSLTVLVGAVVVMGWVLGIRPMAGIIPGPVTMVINTALSFMCLGTALVIIHNTTEEARLHTFGRMLALLVAVVGALTIIEYIADLDLGIDQLVHRDYFNKNLASPGRMSPITSVNFVLLGLALCLYGGRRGGLTRILTIVAGVFTLLGIIGHLYGVTPLFSLEKSGTS